MNEVDMNYKPKSKSNIIVKNIGDEQVLYNPINSHIHVLNKTAYPIWELADGTNTVNTIIQKLTLMFENLKSHNLEEDVCKVLTEFENQGLLE